MRKYGILFYLSCVFLISACSGPGQESQEQEGADSEVVQTEEIEPTFTSIPDPTATEEPTAVPTATEEPTAVPTATQEPTAVPTDTPEPTSTPDGLIFRDDFNGVLGEGWRWENENPERWSFTNDGWLEIVADDFFEQGAEYPFTNMLLRDLPSGNIVISAHIEADPDTNFQQVAIVLWENADTVIAANRGFCAPCGGSGFYFDYTVPGLEPSSYQLPGIEATDFYLRIEITQDEFSLYYALTEGEWERLGRFGNFFAFTQVGIRVANIDVANADDDLIARLDWFEITTLK